MILECRDLSKSFYTKKALNEVSLKLVYCIVDI